MSTPPPSRFTAQTKTAHERLSSNTVGLVALSDFRKRRAEVLEQQEREAREKHLAATSTSTPDRSQTGTPANASDVSDTERKLKKKKTKRANNKVVGKKLLSFMGDEEEEEEQDGGDGTEDKPKLKPKSGTPADADRKGEEDYQNGEGSPAVNGAAASDPGSAATASGSQDKKKSKAEPPPKLEANTAVGVLPRALTKAALRREAAEREALRKEFLELQAAVKATDIAIPFVFYDGTNIPGGIVSVKKGDFAWVFLDKSRKVGAQLGVGGDRTINARRDWARVGVDDLMMVRGTIIIPHHYEFYFFIMNKTKGPGNHLLFDYSAEAPLARTRGAGGTGDAPKKPSEQPVLRRAGDGRNTINIRSLEGANDDPTFTKVVDRRWYERNKHIYPASVWQEFEPEKDYSYEVRRDLGGNTFFYGR